MTTFLTLPLELRNMVYRELLVDKDHARKPQPYGPKAKETLHKTILCTCRQIYEEASTVFYKDNVSLYHVDRFDFRDGSLSRRGDTLADEKFKQIDHVSIRSRYKCRCLSSVHTRPLVDKYTSPFLFIQLTRIPWLRL